MPPSTLQKITYHLYHLPPPSWSSCCSCSHGDAGVLVLGLWYIWVLMVLWLVLVPIVVIMVMWVQGLGLGSWSIYGAGGSACNMTIVVVAIVESGIIDSAMVNANMPIRQMDVPSITDDVIMATNMAENIRMHKAKSKT
ncbi:hypothetical protein J3A83DRAFT_4486096 [Scleroderma citrinum]